MRPYVICHMLSSVDGKIDGDALRAVTRSGEYEATGAMLNGDAWVCGRTTMQQHFAEEELFVSTLNKPAGPQSVYVARRAKSYAVSIDTTGKLRWSGSDIDGDHLICVVSERVPEDYLSMLREKKYPTSSPGQPLWIWLERWTCLANISELKRCCSKEVATLTGRSSRHISSMRLAFWWFPALTAAMISRPCSMA